jgi:hypothetical protein
LLSGLPACARGNNGPGSGGAGGAGDTTGETTAAGSTASVGGAGGAPATSSGSGGASGSSAASSSAASSSVASSSVASSSAASSSAASSSVASSSVASSSAASSSVASSSAASSSASSGSGGGVCALGHLVLSEVRSRGVAGGGDEFVELWNPTGASIPLDSSWMIEGRSATAAAYNARWKGAAGLSIPAHGHFLIASAGYVQAPTADDKLITGITDATSLRLVQGATTIDALCYYFSAANLIAFDATYTCEGVPVSNLPHNDASAAASNSDASLERLPGGSGGSCADTNDNTADFTPRAPADPQNTQSAPTP